MTPGAPIDVSVVICTRDRPDDLAETLKSLSATSISNREKWVGELLVVDNGTSDRTEKVVASFDHPWLAVRYVREPVPGLATARNRAIRETTGAVILFTDDDMRFLDHWIDAMVLPVLSNMTDAVRGAVTLAPHLDRPWMSPLHRALLAETASGVQADFPYLIGANMALHRRIFDAGCKFDEELGAGRSGAGEEIALSLQLGKQGFHILAVDGPAVEHHPDPKRLARSAWRTRMFCEGRSNAILYRRYGDHRRRGALIRLPWDVLRVGVSECRGCMVHRTCPATVHELEQWRQLAFDWELTRQLLLRTPR